MSFNFRLATLDDLPQLIEVYKNILSNMIKNGIYVWNDIYPICCFKEDIEKNRFYILDDLGVIVAGFAIWDSEESAQYVQWQNIQASALYIGRIGVNIDYLRQGVGSLILKKAEEVAKDKLAKFLRLFVATHNEPAIKFYLKNGWSKALGVYDELIEDDTILTHFGFEISLM